MLNLTIVFLYGLLIGSFLNVVIYRLPQGESIIFPPSHCGNCDTRLKVLDLIPILSFLFYKGKCCYCGEKISIQYPLVEILTGIIFLILYWKYNLSVKFLIYLVLACLLITGSIIDLKYMIIPNQLNFFGIIFGIISSLFLLEKGWQSLLLAIIVPATFLLLIVLITKGKGMGIGDVKLVAMIGSFIGVKYTLAGIFLGAFIGSLIGLILMISSDVGMKSRLPFGPLISLGCLVMILWGQEVIIWYFQLFS